MIPRLISIFFVEGFRVHWGETKSATRLFFQEIYAEDGFKFEACAHHDFTTEESAGESAWKLAIVGFGFVWGI